MSTNKCSTMTIKNEMIKKMYGSFEKAAMHVKDVECWSARIVKMPSEREILIISYQQIKKMNYICIQFVNYDSIEGYFACRSR